MELEDKILVVLGMIIVSGYGFSMDMPQALEVPLRAEPYNFGSLEFNMLYFCTYLPITLTDIPLGMILDRFPLHKTVIVITLVSILAELGTALLFDFRPENFIYGVYVMRAFVGMAGSSAFTMQGYILARYAAKYYQLLVGFGLCVPFVFDAIAVTISPIIYDSTKSISLPWYIAVAVDFVSVLASLGISFIVLRKQKRKQDQKQKALKQGQQAQEQQQEQFSCQYLRNMPLLFWLINIMIFFGDLIVGGIYSNLNDLLVNRFKFDYVVAGQLLLIPNLFGTLMTIIIGRILLSFTKSRRKFILVSPILSAAGLLFIYLLPNNSNASELTQGYYVAVIAFLMIIGWVQAFVYTVLCSSITLLADPKYLGTAWGVLGTAIGLGESVGPIINGLIEDSDPDLAVSYRSMNLVYLIISTMSIGMGVLIYLGPYSAIDISLHQTHQNKLEGSILTESMLDDK